MAFISALTMGMGTWPRWLKLVMGPSQAIGSMDHLEKYCGSRA